MDHLLKTVSFASLWQFLQVNHTCCTFGPFCTQLGFWIQCFAHACRVRMSTILQQKGFEIWPTSVHTMFRQFVCHPLPCGARPYTQLAYLSRQMQIGSVDFRGQATTVLCAARGRHKAGLADAQLPGLTRGGGAVHINALTIWRMLRPSHESGSFARTRLKAVWAAHDKLFTGLLPLGESCWRRGCVFFCIFLHEEQCAADSCDLLCVFDVRTTQSVEDKEHKVTITATVVARFSVVALSQQQFRH